MVLKNIITPECIGIGTSAKDKTDILKELANMLAKAVGGGDSDSIYDCLAAREEQMSTGMKHGIAIPHGKTEVVNQLVACLLIVPGEGIEFDALDKKPCNIFVSTVSPEDKPGPHMEFLSAVSNFLKSEENRNALLACKTADDAFKLVQKKGSPKK